MIVFMSGVVGEVRERTVVHRVTWVTGGEVVRLVTWGEESVTGWEGLVKGEEQEEEEEEEEKGCAKVKQDRVQSCVRWGRASQVTGRE